MITVWVLEKVSKEITATGYEPDILGVLRAVEKDGRVPSAWFHREKIIVLHAASGKHGTGKLPANTKRTVEQRLRGWKSSYPKGRADPAGEGMK